MAVLLNFVQMRGETPAQFFGTLPLKKSGKSCPIGGRGGARVEVIWTKSKRTATFFGKPSLRCAKKAHAHNGQIGCPYCGVHCIFTDVDASPCTLRKIPIKRQCWGSNTLHDCPSLDMSDA